MDRITLQKVNEAMRPNTSRAILFTSVNLSKDAPRLEDMLALLQSGMSWTKFSNKVKTELAVHSFKEFMEKMKPCFFYRLNRGGEIPQEGNEGQVYSIEELPNYDFSLDGGPGWTKVQITESHPFIRSLKELISNRVRLRQGADRVNIDEALFGFRPKVQYALVKKNMQSLHAEADRLMLEMKRAEGSSGEVKMNKDIQRAMEALDRRKAELENSLSDQLQTTAIAEHALLESYKAMVGPSGRGGGQIEENLFLTLGRDGRLDVEHIEQLPPPTQKALGSGASAESGAGRTELVPLRNALESKPLAKRDLTEIARIKDKKSQLPAVIGSFMSEMVRLKKIDPVLGNLLAVVLNDPKDLARGLHDPTQELTYKFQPEELAQAHDKFLGVYSKGVQNFIREVIPLFETIMGVYSLFNEFPPDVSGVQPELIVANSELTDLWQTYQEDLVYYLRKACHQAGNNYQDAISFAIVPHVSPFLGQEPASPREARIIAGKFEEDYHRGPEEVVEDDHIKLDPRIEELRHQRIEQFGGFGRVAGASEVLGLMGLGHECGFQVLFSPEDRLISGRAQKTVIQGVQSDYCVEDVVTQPWSVCGVLCAPDFLCLPPDGVLITGKVADGREVAVDVPQVVVRACYVAAGRIMANDQPKVLQSIVSKQSKERLARNPMLVNPKLPGISVDVTAHPIFAETRVPLDEFTGDDIYSAFSGADKSFLVFRHVAGKNPTVVAPRTLYRVEVGNDYRYRMIHHYRQEVYLRRLLLSALAQEGGALPTQAQMEIVMNEILLYVDGGNKGWYDSEGKVVNAFPGPLKGDAIVITANDPEDPGAGYALQLNFKSGVVGDLELSFT